MALLGSQKPILLSQVKRQSNINIEQLVKLLHTYEDLVVDDFRGSISDILFGQLQEAGRDPQEVELWNRIMNAPTDSPAEVQNKQRLVSQYMQQYSIGPKVSEAQSLMNNLQREMAEAMERDRKKQEAEREARDWAALERGNYNSLRIYLNKYPQSVHLSEIDDLMWTNTKTVINYHSLNRYLSDMPLGNHAAEAQTALSEINNWEQAKRSGDLFVVDDYRDNHPNSPFAHEVNSIYYKLRDDELVKMKENPSEYGKDDVLKLINADIFTQYELQDEGLVTDESWSVMTELDRSLFPDIQEYQVENPNIQAPSGCTDIYLFGTPGTGKTCLLMGLTGANGNGYTLNMKVAGGPYASALQQYVNAGITPGRTFGKFVTTINGQVNDPKANASHKINLVEMSGEEFAVRIADGKSVSFANMGTGATNLLKNDNRKVFFIIVDATKDMVKAEYIEKITDTNGSIVGERIRKRYVSQLDILNKFVSLFELPENQDVMKKVDAIHFVVTKADVLGDASERKTKAKELLLKKYAGPVETLKTYCRQTRRINYSSDYRPQAFTFSLGKFYLGDVFCFDPAETIQIINTIRLVTAGEREQTFFDRLRSLIGGN